MAQFTTGADSRGYSIRLVTEQLSQSVSGNSSTVRATLYLHQGNTNFYLYQLGGIISVAGQEKSWSLYIDHARPWNTHFQVAQFTFTVGHDYDGSKSASCRATLAVQGSATPWAPGSHDTGTRYMALTTIPRSSSLRFDSGVIGQPMAFTIDRKASYTHTLRYHFGNLQGTVASGVTTSASWTPPESLASQIPNDVIGRGTIYLDTYNGGSRIGTTSHAITLSVPNSMVPTTTGISLSDGNSKVSAILPANQFLKTVSVLKASLAGVSGVQGSTIKSYHFQLVTNSDKSTGLQSSVNGGALGTVTVHGNYKVRGWVVDSRGRSSAVREISLTIHDYALPAVNIRVDRTSSSETLANVTRTASVSSVMVGGREQNRLSLSFRVRELPDGYWSEVGGDAVVSNSLTLALNASMTGIAGSYAPEKAYEFEATVSDKFQSNQMIARLGGVSVVHSYSINNFGFGKIPSKENVVDSEWPYLYRGSPIQLTPLTESSGHAMLAKDDWNNYKKTGFYRGSNLANQPPTPKGVHAWKYVRVSSHATSWCVQEAIDFYGKTVWVRALVDGNWQEWHVPGLDQLYPVGAIYQSTVATDPSTLMGGTWKRFGQGRVLVGVSENETEFATASKIGGSKTHRLTVEEMPSHSHRQVVTANEGSAAIRRDFSSDGRSNAYDQGVSTGNAGGGQSHNNLQPYITVYMWQRTA